MNNHIKIQLQNARLVLFFGAGASFGSKNQEKENPPLAGELAEQLATHAGLSYEGEQLSDIYDAAKSTIGDLKLTEFLELKYKHCTPSAEYRYLAKFAFQRVYTINIDDSFEKALHLVQGKKFHVKQRADRVIDADQLFQTLCYIKLNGDIANPREGFIFSSQEYAAGAVRDLDWYSELAADFHKYTILFIGTKLDEPLFNHHIEMYKAKGQENSVKSYLLVPNISEIKKKVLENKNIYHIKGTLSDFVKWLKDQFPLPVSPEEILLNVRPELVSKEKFSEEYLSLLDGVTPVTRNTLPKITSDNAGRIRDFYKGFKPTWKDIIDDVPIALSKVDSFFESCLKNNIAKTGKLYMILGSAGSGKTTSLMQIALRLSDLGERVYYAVEFKSDIKKLVEHLEKYGGEKYYLIIERVADLAAPLGELFDSKAIKRAVVISAESISIWNFRVKHNLNAHVDGRVDISQIAELDVPGLLNKIKLYGVWTRLEKMTKKNRKINLYRQAKSQLLIGLLKTTYGEGYQEIIYKDYKRISNPSEKALVLLVSLASINRAPAQESTLTRALSSLGYKASVHAIASKLEGIVKYKNGAVNIRHPVYAENLLDRYVTVEEMSRMVHAYLSAFTVYSFPVVKHVDRNEASIYKLLVNYRNLDKLLRSDSKRILAVYSSYEKKFENEGLFLMQYGLALRGLGRHEDALEKLNLAKDAFPESHHIEHALAQQRIILATIIDDKPRAMQLFSLAEDVLSRLHKAKVNVFDRYPVVTLAEGHVQFLHKHGEIDLARDRAKKYHEQLRKLLNSSGDMRLNETVEKLTRYVVNRNWPSSDSNYT